MNGPRKKQTIQSQVGIIILVIVLVCYGLVSQVDLKNVPEMTNIQKRERLANACLGVLSTTQQKGIPTVVYLKTQSAAEVNELMKRQRKTRGFALVLPARDFSTWSTDPESRPEYKIVVYFYLNVKKTFHRQDSRELSEDTIEFESSPSNSGVELTTQSCWANGAEGWKIVREWGVKQADQ